MCRQIGFALRATTKRGASDARLTPLKTTRLRRGLKVAWWFPSTLTWTALHRRPSPVVAASSRPSVCVRCPRHENRLKRRTKTPTRAASRLTSFSQSDALGTGEFSRRNKKVRAATKCLFVSRRRQGFVSRGLPRAEGRKFAEARGEGRPTVVTTELLNEASRRPSGQRAATDFRAAERRSASRRGSWFAPVGAAKFRGVKEDVVFTSCFCCFQSR